MGEGESHKPNLIVTIDERHRYVATKEIGHLLRRVGADRFRVTASPGKGLIGIVLQDMDAKVCNVKLHELLSEEPLAFAHTHRWIPVESWGDASHAELSRFARLADARIAPGESWAIKLEKHESSLDRFLLINTLAVRMQNRHVRLDHPDKTILLEVIRNEAAMAVVSDEEFLSVDRELKDEFVNFGPVGTKG